MFATLALIVFAGLTAVLNTERLRLLTKSNTLEKQIDSRERLEDRLEEALVKQITPGDRLDVDAYYPLLVDRIITDADPDFIALSNFLAENLDDAPGLFSGYEFHEFIFLTARGSTECRYIIIASDNRCVSVVLVSTHVGLYPP